MSEKSQARDGRPAPENFEALESLRSRTLIHLIWLSE